MGISFWKDWGALIGSVVAALVSSISLWRQMSADKDRIYVGAGTVTPSPSRGEDLHIVNRSSHAVTIRDYGAVLFTGEIFSYPFEEQVSTPGDALSGYLIKDGKLEPQGVAEVTCSAFSSHSLL